MPMLTTEHNEKQMFERAMVIAGWDPIPDVFGGIYAWRHSETGRVVNSALAAPHFAMTGQTPVVSLQEDASDG